MDQIEEFEKYFNGLMEDEERSAFKEKLEKDPELRKAFRFHEEMYNALRDKQAIELRKKLIYASRRYRKQDKGLFRFPGKRTRYLIAASMVITIGLAALILLQKDRLKIFSGEELVLWLPGEDNSPEFTLPESYYTFNKILYRGEEPDMLTPVDSAVFKPGQTINFKWDHNIKPALDFYLCNWHDSTVLEKKFSGTGFRIVAPEERGIYYYRVEEDSHLVKLGIFFIDQSR